MGAKGTRKGRRGLVRYLYNPVSQALGALKNTASATTNTVKKVVRNGINGVNTVGRKVSGRANAAIKGLVPKRFTRRRR